MKKLSILICILIAAFLVGCGKKDSSSTQKESKTDVTSKSSYINDSSSMIDNPSSEAIIHAQKFFPSDFSEAINVEANLQDTLNKTNVRVEQDNATHDAFVKMTSINNSYYEKIKGLLIDNQKQAFENLLIAEKQYNAYFDMFSNKVLIQQVFTTGNAACSEEYNLAKSNAIVLYYYYNYLNNQNEKNKNINNYFDNHISNYMFFSSNPTSLKEKTLAELNDINKQTSPLIRNVLNSTSQTVFDEYKAAYEKYLSAITEFEKSIGINTGSSNIYYFTINLNTSLINNLYSELKDKNYEDGMFEKLNGDLNKAEYLEKWNYNII